MKVDASISNQVLDRIKVSDDHLGEAIHRPGEDRCFKGDALGQLIRQGERMPEPVIEPISTEFLIKQPLEEESLAPQLAAVPFSSAADRDVERLESEITVLKETVTAIPATLDEMRGEIGKLVANSRREQTRIGKRMDQLEQGREGGVEPEIAQLQQQIIQLEQLSVDTSHSSAERPAEMEQRLVRLEEALSQSEQAVEVLIQQQAEQAQRMLQLQQSLEQGQQLVLEQSKALSEQSTQMQALQQQIELSQASNTDDMPLLNPLKQQLSVLEQSYQQLTNELTQLAQQKTAGSGVSVDADEGPLKQDGRTQSIVEELRYEIGEVRKSNSRQLDALNSKLHAVTTSSEVNQIVKHATLQLQQKIDDITEKIEQNAQPVSMAIRF